MPNRNLAQLADDYWDTFLLAYPVQGTAMGDHRYSDRLEPVSDAERDAVEGRLATFQSRREPCILAEFLDEDALSLASLQHAVARIARLLDADPLSYTVDAMNGPQVELHEHPVAPAPAILRRRGVALLSRWRAMGPWLDQASARLRSGLRDGLSPIAVPVGRVIAQLDDRWIAPSLTGRSASRPAHRTPWTDAAFRHFADELIEVVSYGIRPALPRYRAFLADEALRRARDEAHAGIGNLAGRRRTLRPAGPRTYDHRPGPEELHAIGLAEIGPHRRRDRRARRSRHRDPRVSRTRFAALRTDPARCLHQRRRAHGDRRTVARRRERRHPRLVRSAAAHALRGRRRCPPRGGALHDRLLPRARRRRRPAGALLHEHLAPETRPRYEAEALAFHESVPGHHLQIAIGQELTGLPAFRRHAEVTAFIEGWGLYTERLANEMGLYAGDLDRIGMLSYDAWRASRLVVDTGMHALGWSRSRRDRLHDRPLGAWP